jgi:DNA-binding Lrp family transcriptional regulator
MIREVDDLDRAILEILHVDGRVTNADLAARVGLSPAPCLRRVRRLEEVGIIRGYTALIDPVALGRAFEVIVTAEVAVNNQRNVQDFEEQIARLDEVSECQRLFGRPDYLIRVHVADAETYERFVSERLMALPGISRVDSTMAMKIIKSPTYRPRR